MLALAISILIAPIAIDKVQPINDLLSMATMMLHETATGAAIGLSVELCFEAVRFAGQLCGTQLGLSLASVIDPISQSESTVVSSFFETVALALFFAFGVHEKLLSVLFASYSRMPIGATLHSEHVLEALAHFSGRAFSSGIGLATPVIAITLLLDTVVALIARVAPQLPAVPVGISLKTLTGMSVIAVGISFWPATLAKLFHTGLEVATGMLR
jgi:flagellar biosynthesis protein FliR